MKRIWPIAIILAILFTAGPDAAGMTSAVARQQEPIAGGYGDTANNDPDAVAAARFAIRRQSRKRHARIALVSIKRAEVQVVAGLNYRLCLRVRIKRRTQTVTVVVYKNLKRKYSLTSWVAAGCAKQ